MKITNLKLSDFGSAHFYGVEGVAKTATPEYIPPENLLNKNEINMNQTSTDIWSLGIILLEIVSGIPVWMNFNCQIT